MMMKSNYKNDKSSSDKNDFSIKHYNQESGSKQEDFSVKSSRGLASTSDFQITVHDNPTIESMD